MILLRGGQGATWVCYFQPAVPRGLVACWKRALADISGKTASKHLYSMKEATPSFTAQTHQICIHKVSLEEPACLPQTDRQLHLLCILSLFQHAHAVK